MREAVASLSENPNGPIVDEVCFKFSGQFWCSGYNDEDRKSIRESSAGSFKHTSSVMVIASSH